MYKLIKNRTLSAFIAFAMLLGLVTIPTKEVKANKASNVVISEVYGGGGNGGSTYKNDFIELYNPTDNDIDLTGWKVEYASKTGDFATTTNKTSLSGTIKKGGYLLIQQAKGTAGTVELPTADIIGNIPMSGTDCKVRLLNNDVQVVDMIGIGVANESETLVIKGMTNILSVQRKDNDGSQIGNTNGWDTNNNSLDFYPKEPTPRNSQYTGGEVTPPIEIPVTAITVAKTLALEVGAESTLSVAYVPENTTEIGVNYSIDKTDVANIDVNTGKITAIKEGTAQVTVVSKVKTEIKATCDITVSKPQDKVGPELKDLMPAPGTSIITIKNPEISANLVDESGVDMTSVKMLVDGTEVTEKIVKINNSIKYQTLEDFKDGNHTVVVEVRDSLGNITLKDWSFTIGKQLKNIYFGQLHSHTNISDGQGTLDDAYSNAKGVGNLDFFAVTDHSNWFDNDTKASIKDASASTEWKQGHDVADQYNKDGEFAAIYGYEMTWSGSTGGYGHMNTFNTPGFETRSNSKMDLKTYYAALKTQPQSISQFNHPGKTFGDFSDFAFYDAEIDKTINLLEVGNGEGSVGGSGYFPSYEYYTRALDKGWKVAPTNNQDNHKGNWGNANTARTVIEAPSLSREDVYQALRDMRVYSSEDNNLKISYEVNGRTMGSTLEETDILNFSINVNDETAGDNIKTISIIGDGGKVIKSITDVNSTTKQWDFTLDSSDSSYYYVKVDEADKEIAVTAPVWVGTKESAGLSSFSADTNKVIVGEGFNLQTVIYNNEATAINGAKIEYFTNNGQTSLGSEIVPTLLSGGTYTSKIPYKLDKAGDYSFSVKVTMNINGVDKVSEDSISIEALNSGDVVKIVLDGSKQNQYVSGDYSGKMNTLSNVVSQNNGKLILNTATLTDEILNGVSILAITDPQSVTKTVTGFPTLIPQKYSDEEIQVIKRFMDKGGNLFITSKADYGDGVNEYQNSAQGNSILKALGSNMTFNDDQVIDTITNGGQSYRLYFNQYGTNKWVSAVDTTKRYSFYSGSSVLVNKDATNVDILVKGHSTTTNSDADVKGDFTPVPAGEVIGLAVETLASGGKIVASGATFFSDFEMDGTDNTNLEITQNIIKDLAKAKELPVSKIADIRIDANNDNNPDRFGEKVSVEGYVTAASNSAIPGNSFFDVIYIQDDTAGVTVFGVSTKAVKLGQKVKISGKVSSYLGDGQIAIENEINDLQVLDESINLVPLTKLSTKDSMLEEKEGLLVQVKGTVSSIVGQSIFVNDGSGDSRVYVEGYITSSKNPGVADEWKTRIKVGDTITAIGLASEDPEGHRLRVRDSAEIESTEAKITILHTNDTHGRVKSDSSIIGIDTIAAIKNLIPNSLLVDAGDTLHGLPFATMNKGADIVELMKMAGYDLMTPGNHDFNYGYERLLELKNLANTGDNGFDIISANVMNGENQLLNANSIKIVDGVKVGFFGLTTPETTYKTNPNNVNGIDFRDPIVTAREQVQSLKAQGAEVIIALAHIGTDKSSEVTSEIIAREVAGIDVIIDGHSHSKYATGLQGENNTLIVSTGEYEGNLGQLALTINKETRKIESKIATLIPKATAALTTPDAKVKAKIAEIDASQSLILSQVVGNSLVTLDGLRDNVRTKETNLGNLITDAMINTTGADIAITNGGGIRASINVGEITKGEIINVLPFGNFIVTKYLTGAQIKDVLEHGVKAFPASAGQFTHVGGIKYVFDKNQPAGSRIVSITFNNNPLEMGRKYLVAANDFMAAGGDGYPHFKDIRTENEFNALDESLAQYITKLENVNYGVDGRITVYENNLPTINASDITLPVGEIFNPLNNVTASDKEDGDITSSIRVITNTVDSNIVGQYTVVYEVTDKNGAIATKTIVVKVEAVVIYKPTNLTVKELGSKSLVLNWDKQDTIFGLVGYRIYKDGKFIAEVSKDEGSYKVENLRVNTIYGFKITAKYSNGVESKPISVNVRTLK